MFNCKKQFTKLLLKMLMKTVTMKVWLSLHAEDDMAVSNQAFKILCVQTWKHHNTDRSVCVFTCTLNWNDNLFHWSPICPGPPYAGPKDLLGFAHSEAVKFTLACVIYNYNDTFNEKFIQKLVYYIIQKDTCLPSLTNIHFEWIPMILLIIIH